MTDKQRDNSERELKVVVLGGLAGGGGGLARAEPYNLLI